MLPASPTLTFEYPKEVSVNRVTNRGKMAELEARSKELDPEISIRRIMYTRGNMALIQQVLSEEKMKFVVVDTKQQLDLIQDELKTIMSSAGFALLVV